MSTSQNTSLERVTVNLIPRAAKALADGAAITGDSKTDFINRAIQVYAYLEKLSAQGGQVFAQEPGSAELAQVKFI